MICSHLQYVLLGPSSPSSTVENDDLFNELINIAFSHSNSKVDTIVVGDFNRLGPLDL